MRISKSEEVHKDKVEYEIQALYMNEIQQLRALNFTEEYYVKATIFPLSAVVFLPVIVIMWLYGEKLGIAGWLQAVTFNPFLIHEDGYAYVEVMKMGVKFVTMFDDATMLSTVTYRYGGAKNEKYRYSSEECVTTNLAVAWQQHKRRVEALANEDRCVISPLNMADINHMQEHCDRVKFGFEPPTWDDKLKHKR
jgi:hypothetical protein